MSNAALQALTENQSALTDTLERLLEQLAKNQTSQEAAITTRSKNVISDPEPFKSGAADARRFLQYFTLWARSQGLPLNDKPNGTGNPLMWIQAALSELQDEAA